MSLLAIVNCLAVNLTSQVRSIAKVTKAVAHFDLSKQIEVDCSSEILDLINTVNGMVFLLQVLATEVTHVTLEVRVNWAVRLSFRMLKVFKSS